MLQLYHPLPLKASKKVVIKVTQILPCPDCQRITFLSQDLPDDAEVRCPSCQATFTLAQLYSQLPAWEVISGEVTIAAGADAAPQPADAHDEELQLSATGAGTKRADAAPSGWDNFQPITHEQFERNKKKQRSPLWPIVQVVLGGLAAFPIALLILWYGLGKDVMDAGPTVARFAPWLVPQQFHPVDIGTIDLAAAGSIRPARGASGFRNFDEELESEDARRPTDADSPELANSVEPTGSPAMSALDQETDNGRKLSEESSTLQATTDPAEQQPFGTQPNLQVTVTGRRILTAVAKCKEDIRAWVSQPTDSAPNKELASDVYADLMQLAALIDKVPKSDPYLPAIREVMQPIGRAIKRLPDVQALISQGATYWVAKQAKEQSASDSQALAIVVELLQVENQDSHWVAVPTAETALHGRHANLPQTRICIPKAIAPAIIPGQRLLLLGTQKPVASSTSTASNPGNGTDKAITNFEKPDQATNVFTASYIYAIGEYPGPL